jgi:hypothetical protein
MEVKVMLLRIGLSAGRNLIWVMEDWFMWLMHIFIVR